MRDRIILGGVALVTLAHCKAKSHSDNTCEGATAATTGQALTMASFRGASLPPKTIALTFDDGPGDRTSELSLWLKDQGIEAAFFVNGYRFDAQAPGIMQGLIDDGHIIGNHTETHASLTGEATATPHPDAATVIKELTDTDAKIAPFIKNDRWLFRPPFGDYDQQDNDWLDGTPMKKYIGPILWDVGYKMDAANGEAADWDCWQDGSDAKRYSVTDCGDLYITQIKHISRGIVLMHDPYFNELDPQLGGTVDMVKYIVPKLKAEGFTFIRVDKIPDINAVLPPLQGSNPDGGGGSSSGDNNAAPGQNGSNNNGGAQNVGGTDDKPCP